VICGKDKTDGKAHQMEYFNLDAILSIGYRVNSKDKQLK